jgi:hypothetical protein
VNVYKLNSPSPKWRQDFDKYLLSVPFYYYSLLKNGNSNLLTLTLTLTLLSNPNSPQTFWSAMGHSSDPIRGQHAVFPCELCQKDQRTVQTRDRQAQRHSF